MKYVCLVYGEEKQMAAMTDDEGMAYHQALRNAGQCLASEALQPVRSAATGRVRNGNVSITDGPFSETKECLAGFYLIEAGGRDHAVQSASEIPPARGGSIEVRPVRELTSTTGQRRRVSRYRARGAGKRVIFISNFQISIFRIERLSTFPSASGCSSAPGH